MPALIVRTEGPHVVVIPYEQEQIKAAEDMFELAMRAAGLGNPVDIIGPSTGMLLDYH